MKVTLGSAWKVTHRFEPRTVMVVHTFLFLEEEEHTIQELHKQFSGSNTIQDEEVFELDGLFDKKIFVQFSGSLCAFGLDVVNLK